MSENTETLIKGTPGRKPHEPTDAARKKVKSYAAIGIPQQDIARVMHMSINTLRKHYIDELDTGGIEANAAIGGALYNRAISGDTGSLVWWTKARMGWRGENHLGRDQQPAEPVTEISYVEHDASRAE